MVDEADSILIDEARLPLVIAGGETVHEALASKADEIARQLRPTRDYTIDEHGHNVSLTDDGVAAVERAFDCGNLFRESNITLHSAMQNSLHAHALLQRDIDYLVKDGSIELVDELPIQLPSATLLGVGHCVSETEDIGSIGTGWEARTGNPSLSQPCSGGACGPPGSLCACLHQFSSLLFGKNSCFYRLQTSRHSALTASLRLSANSRSHTQCAPAPVALHS